MSEINKTYIVIVSIMKEKYYLASLSGTISKSICDSLIFPNENVACFYATKMENIYQGSLGKVESVTFYELI